jgi:Uma2 family endonuclease
MVRAVVLDVPERWVCERRERGADRWDECWEGELHMVPPPSDAHQRLAAALVGTLWASVQARALVVSHETGVFLRDRDLSNYRIPDLVFTRPEHRFDAGVSGGAELVVEIRSPDDETYAKLGFYARAGVAEVLVIDRDTRAVELFVNRGEQMMAVQAADDGSIRLRALGVTIRRIDDAQLHLAWADGEATI